ncbi:uncharacterized protein [Anabrus simplex]|uniref:uncharacterized protein n=1 Tax=Anabrus simplex TaxID=316456 RepID=UPI0035A30BB3
MDQKVEIKEEPTWLEEEASTSFLSADVKDELIKEELTVGQLAPCLKEENKLAVKGFPECKHQQTAPECKSLTPQDIMQFRSLLYFEEKKKPRKCHVKIFDYAAIKEIYPNVGTNTQKGPRAKYICNQNK